MPELVTHYRMGQDIPEWLLTAEPVDASSVGGQLRFGADVDVLDTPGYYAVLPTRILEPISGLIDASGMFNVRMLATAKPVRLIGAETVPYPLGLVPPPGTCPPYTLIIQPWHVQVVPVPDPHPGFWRRLWWALKGG